MIRLAAVFLLVSLAGWAQEWSNVLSLRKGDRVGVIQSNQRRVEGRFQRATESGIALQAGQVVTVEKADVVRVYKLAKHSRAFGAIVGGAIGVAAGAVVDGTFGQYLRNEGHGPAVGVTTVIGAGAGAGVGLAATGRYQTVYRRAK